jgi:2,3-bisphosphoglycerate-independent phosphoglycerate mutase
MRPKPVVLMILDGWGERPYCPENAISCAHPVHFSDLVEKYPYTVLDASVWMLVCRQARWEIRRWDI